MPVNSLDQLNYDLELEKQLAPENFRDDEAELADIINNCETFDEFVKESGMGKDEAHEYWEDFWSDYQDYE